MGDIFGKVAFANQAKKENYVYNAGIGLKNWRAALAQVQSSGTCGTSALTKDISIIGDSITEGYSVRASLIGNGADAIRYGWTGILNNNFQTKLGLDDVGTGLIHCHRVGKVASSNKDEQFVQSGGTWTRDYAYGVQGTALETSTNGAKLTISFSGTGVKLLYVSRGLHSHFTYAIDGGAPVDVDTYNVPNITCNSTTITGLADDTHTLEITKASDGITFKMIGIVPIKGTKGIRVNNCGLYGSVIFRVPYYSASAYGSLDACIDFFTPPLTIIAMVANDYGGQTALSSYITDMQTTITRAKTFGDVMLVAYCPQGNSYAIPMSSYADAVKSLAMANDCCYVDLISKWKDYTTANAAGMMQDTVHPNAVGHQAIANDIWNVLIDTK